MSESSSSIHGVVPPALAKADAEESLSPELVRLVYSQIAKINGEINRMEPKKLKSKLLKYNLNVEGNIDIQRKRLKNFYRKVKLASAKIYVNQELLPYYVVMDFEATCEANSPPDYKHEIIEFPGVLVNTKTLQIVDTFRKFCRPSVKPTLSDFCKELTGITQEEIDKADAFPIVFQEFLSWLDKHELGSKHDFAVVTDGSWDTCRFLYVQCLISNLPYPEWAKKWINIRKIFSNYYKFGKPGLASMLDHLGMSFEGRKHCGLDDAKNIARVLIHLMCDGANVQVNETLTPQSLRTQSQLLSNPNSDELQERLSQLNLEGEKMPVGRSNKSGTFNDIKKERYKMEAKLALKLRESNSNSDDGALEEGDEANINSSPFRRKHGNRTPKKKKKPRKLCH